MIGKQAPAKMLKAAKIISFFIALLQNVPGDTNRKRPPQTLAGHGKPKTRKRPGLQKGVRADYKGEKWGILCCFADYATERRERERERARASKNCAESFTIPANLLIVFSVPEQGVPAGRLALIVAPLGAF
jgi:hypothetical protein